MFTTSTTVSKGGALPCFLGILLMLSTSISLRAQEVKRAITGKVVVEDSKQPMAGATVRIKGSDVNAKTDNEGKFTIVVGDKDKELIISYVGFESKHIKIDAATKEVAAVGLKMEATALKNIDVYANGYQSVSAERSTGSYSQINNKLFNRVVSRNVLDRIGDVTSGMLMSKGGGELNPLSNVMVRGVSTINSSKLPLLIVDNFPYDGNINDINPNDIESVTVLKDAAAASIWGVQAGNGVIVLTTKRGRFNQPVNVQLNTNITIGSKPNLSYLKTMSSQDEIEFEMQRFKNGFYNDYDDTYPAFGYVPSLPPVAEILLAARRKGIADPLTDPSVVSQLNALSKHDVREDIKKYLLQTSVGQQYALNISGGGSNYNYYASVGYDKTRGIQVGNNKDERITLRLLNTWRPLDGVEIRGEISHTQSNFTGSTFDYVSLLPTSGSIAPYTRLVDNVGNASAIPFKYRLSYVDTARYPALLDWHYRPIDEAKNNSRNNKSGNDRLTLGVKYNFAKDFDLELNGQYQRTSTINKIISDEQTFNTRDLINQYMSVDPNTGEVTYPLPLGSIYNRSDGLQTSWNVRGQINFKHIESKHSIFALAGLEFRQNEIENYTSPNEYGFDPNTYTFQHINNSILYPIRPDGSSSTIGNSAYISGKLLRYGSYFVNGSYTYDSKYTLYASGRVDQSNFFGVDANDRIKPLWSAGVAWNIAGESFYKQTWLPQLKLKGSYGFSGNTNNSGSAYAIAQYSPGSLFASLIPAPFATIINPANPSLKWEKVKIINLGIEFGSRHERINGSLEFYQKWGQDLISDVDLDPTTGFISYIGNNASIKGRGWDFTLNTRNIDGVFKWNTTLLLSSNKDEVTSYAVPPPVTGEGYALGNPIVKGKPLNKLYSFNWAGLDPADGDAQLYVDNKAVKSIDYISAKPEDVVYSGPSTPQIFGSINNTFSWKNISLSFNIIYRFHYYFRRSSMNYTGLLSGIMWGGHADYAQRWKEAGDEKFTNVPALPDVPDNRDVVYNYSNILIEKGDHIRLQDIRLEYQIDKWRFKSLPLRSVSAFAYAQNIGILWRANKYNIDPEFGDLRLPLPFSISFGLNINF